MPTSPEIHQIHSEFYKLLYLLSINFSVSVKMPRFTIILVLLSGHYRRSPRGDSEARRRFRSHDHEVAPGCEVENGEEAGDGLPRHVRTARVPTAAPQVGSASATSRRSAGRIRLVVFFSRVGFI